MKDYVPTLHHAKKVDPAKVEIYSYDLEDGIVGQMDGSGSNVLKIDESMPGVVKMLITSRIDHPDVQARERATDLEVPLVEVDFAEFEKSKGVEKGMFVRAVNNIDALEDKDIKMAYQYTVDVRDQACKELLKNMYDQMDAYGIKKDIPHFGAGFMSLWSDDAIKDLFVLTVHPGDLTKYSNDHLIRGQRRLTGDAWVPSARAFAAGDEELYSSIFLTMPGMDTGEVFMRGYALPVDYNRLQIDERDKEQLKIAGKAAQNTLKHIGDHVIAGATFKDLFEGKWGRSDGDLVYRFMDDWYKVPNGIRIQDHVINTRQTPFQLDPFTIEQKVEEFYDMVREDIGP